MANIAMMSTVGIFHLVLYMVIAKVVMASSSHDDGSSFLLNETNSGSGSGEQSSLGQELITLTIMAILLPVAAMGQIWLSVGAF